jgi:hypothetical protein
MLASTDNYIAVSGKKKGATSKEQRIYREIGRKIYREEDRYAVNQKGISKRRGWLRAAYS